MAKKETEKELTSKSNDTKDSLETVEAETEKKDQDFRIPCVNSLYKAIQRKLNKHKKRVYSKIVNDKEKSKKMRRRSRRNVVVEKASDKNIATLLRSERLLEFIKKGSKIPYDIGSNISKKTGFKTVNDLNDYISANRKKFIVLVEKKEKHCQKETNDCNNTLRRADSVDLNLYFDHHYGDSSKDSTAS